MNISPVSFGKIVKVNAPLYVAFNIAGIANGSIEAKDKVKSDVKSIFNDAKCGNTYAIPDKENSAKSYILSGEEASRYLDSYRNAINVSGEAHSCFGLYNYGMSVSSSKEVWEAHARQTDKLIDEKYAGQEIDVEYNPKNMKIKSVNLVS